MLVWGTGKDFWNLYNVLKLNEIAGNIEIVGYVSKERDLQYIDNKEVILPNEITNNEIDYEYIIVATNAHYYEICDYGSKKIGIERKRFINGKVFFIPYFEWNRYLSIYNNNISIVTETCTGGVLSNNLGLPFCSPFVNTRIGIEKNDYFHLLEKLDEYMRVSPTEDAKYLDRNFNWNGWEGRTVFPKLWYDDILIHGFHYQSQQAFFDIWEKRRKRYNSNNKIIFKILYDEEDVEKFERLGYAKKVGIYYKKTNAKNIVLTKCDNLSDKYAYQYASYIFDWIKSGEVFRYVDVFRLFNGEENWNHSI